MAETCPHCGGSLEALAIQMQAQRLSADERADAMVTAYRSGKTLQEIGNAYGITRERVRQILKLKGVSYENGRGKVVQAHQKAKAADYYAGLNRRCFARTGMNRDEYDAARKTQSPCGTDAATAFRSQRNQAKHCRVKWDLTFAEWWEVWQSSGKWDQRGKGAGHYFLARKNLSLPFQSGNVEVVECASYHSLRRSQERESGRGWHSRSAA